MAVATISDSDITTLASQYSLPPALLQGVVKAAGTSDTFGMPAATLQAFGVSPSEAKSDPMLVLAVVARVLAQSFTQHNSWEEALSSFLTGDPHAYTSPTSSVGGQVESILGAAALDPTFGLSAYRPASGPTFAAMAGALGTQLQRLVRSGGTVNRAAVQQFQQQVDAVAASSHSFMPDANLQQVATDVLQKMSALTGQSYAATPANVALITTMARGEGMPAQDFNWLASTQGQGIGTVPGTPGVNVYGSYGQGIEETAKTFLNGNFDALLGHMRNGSDLQTIARDPKAQANLRTWQGGSSEDVNNLLSTRNVAGTGGSSGSSALAQGLQEAAQNNAQSYSSGECTYYAARSLGFIPGGLGNADDWAGRASGMGMQVDATPAVGTAVVYGPSGPYSPQYGHVAVVKQVNPDGTFVVSEMNVYGQGVVDERTSTMQSVIGFIHPPAGTDMGKAAPGLAQQVAATSASTPQQQARQSAAVAAASPSGGTSSMQQRMAAREPQPAQIGDFAAQLQAAGIPVQDFTSFFPGVAASLRRDMGNLRVEVSDFVQAYQGVVQSGQTPNPVTLTAQIRSQPHPTYPTLTVGQVADAKSVAALPSITHTGRTPTTAEAARLALAGANMREMTDYYARKAAMPQPQQTSRAAPASATQPSPQPAPAPTKTQIAQPQTTTGPDGGPQVSGPAEPPPEQRSSGGYIAGL